MKLSIAFMMLLCAGTKVFALPDASDHKQPASYASIDKLNDISFNIYLQSPDSARRVAEKALLLSEKLKYPFGVGRSFMNIGFVYWSQSYYPIALFYLNKALASLPEDKPLYLSDCHMVMARTYIDLGNSAEAYKSLDKAELYAGADAGRLAEVYSVRAYSAMMLKNYNEAIIYADRALRLNKTAGNKSNTAVTYARLSDIYNRKGEYKAALPYSDTAYQMAIQTHNNRLRANNYVQYALIYQNLMDCNKAAGYAKKGALLADSIGVVEAATDAYNILITCSEEQQDLKKAMTFQKEYDRIRDSLNRFDQIKNTELIQSYFSLNSRLNDIALAEHDSQERTRLVNTVLSTLFKLVLIFACNLAALTGCYFFDNYHKS